MIVRGFTFIYCRMACFRYASTSAADRQALQQFLLSFLQAQVIIVRRTGVYFVHVPVCGTGAHVIVVNWCFLLSV